MADDNDTERTESATPRRLEQAREEGHLARSQELTTFAMLMAGGGGLWWLGGNLFGQMRQLLRHGLQLDAAAASDPAQMTTRLYELAASGFLALAPLFAVLLLVALAAPQLLSGWNFSVSALRFDLQRLDPVAGFGRLLSWRGGAELVKALLKSALITVVAAAVMWHYREPLQQLVLLTPEAAIAQTARVAGMSFLLIAGALAVVAAIDVPFQLWRHADDLKMSRQELRQEHKESEGDPQIKAAIRNQQRAMARRRMMAEVPKASVIVTNPTHYAVALSYEDRTMRAPRVVAKGADLVAARIREIGAEHRVPVLESPALARAIYHHTEIGAEIPETLYTAVAEVLAYVFQLRRHRDFGEVTPLPLRPVAVPAGLDPQGAAQ
jgi:flagellar biosynthesis protein FlhB